MIGRPSRHRRLDPLKAQLGNIKCSDEGIDHANRIALVNPVIEAFRQQRRLRPIRPCNEALHQFPRRIIRRILAAPAFSHTQGQPPPSATGSSISNPCPNLLGYLPRRVPTVPVALSADFVVKVALTS